MNLPEQQRSIVTLLNKAMCSRDAHQTAQTFRVQARVEHDTDTRQLVCTPTEFDQAAALKIGHVHVEEHKGWAFTDNLRQASCRAVLSQNSIPGVLEDGATDGQDDFTVVNDKNRCCHATFGEIGRGTNCDEGLVSVVSWLGREEKLSLCGDNLCTDYALWVVRPAHRS